MTKIKIKITAPVAGKYNLSHNIGDVVDMDAKQAQVMIDAGDAVNFKETVKAVGLKKKRK